MKILLVGDFHNWSVALERSYQRAFEALGCEVVCFDIQYAVDRAVRLGRVGRILNTYFPIDIWVQRANRQLVITVIEQAPDIIVLFGKYPYRVGALAQIKTMSPAPIVHIWPDTFVNWGSHLTELLPVCDVLATYSSSSISVFERMGARRAIWLPLAGDPTLYQSDSSAASRSDVGTEVDITFIGGWRPEREAVLSKLTGYRLQIWGPNWGKYCHDQRLLKSCWQKRGLYDEAFARAVMNSHLNLNVIDQTNFPAANMRFFELLTVGGLQLCSACPEMEPIFRNGEHLFYFYSPQELLVLIEELLQDEHTRRQVAQNGHELVLQQHTYVHRAQTLLRELGYSCPAREVSVA